jgi:hypothetical protein
MSEARGEMLSAETPSISKIETQVILSKECIHDDLAAKAPSTLG